MRSHAAEMFAVLGDPAIYEFENAPPDSLELLERRFERLETRASSDGAEQWLNWVIRLPTGELAGYVQATVTRAGVAHVAYELASRFWRRGIASAAVEAMLGELALSHGARLFAATLKATNHRSAALLRKLGFDLGPPGGFGPVGHGPDETVMYRLPRHQRPIA